MKVSLATQKLIIDAPLELVFQMMSAIGSGRLPGSNERSKVLQRDGDTLIAEFLTPSGNKTYRTVEEVRLFPPHRITYRHLEGPITYSEEEFLLAEVSGGSIQLTYTGVIEYRAPFVPGLGWLASVLYIKPKYDTVIRDHMALVKKGAEGRAARSHVFPRTKPAPTSDDQSDASNA